MSTNLRQIQSVSSSMSILKSLGSIFLGFYVYLAYTSVCNATLIGCVHQDAVCKLQITEVTDSFIFKLIYSRKYTLRCCQDEDNDGQAQCLEVQIPIIETRDSNYFLLILVRVRIKFNFKLKD